MPYNSPPLLPAISLQLLIPYGRAVEAGGAVTVRTTRGNRVDFARYGLVRAAPRRSLPEI
jgi:hypothetical protein